MKVNIEVYKNETIETKDRIKLVKKEFEKDLVKLLKKHYNDWKLDIRIVDNPTMS